MPEALRPHSFALTSLSLFAIIAIRYFLFAGTFYWLFYQKRLAPHRKIRPDFPSRRIQQREILWSLSTSVIFALAGAWLVHAWAAGGTRFYTDIDAYGWGWFFGSIPVMMAIQETYFYWTHRWIHHPLLFRRVHRVHHESHNPTPWAAFSFHPWEAVIQAAVLPLLVFTIPVHPVALLLYLMIMTLLSVINHLGFEIYPTEFEETRLGRWMITASHHFLHHHRGRGNYGLYVTTWDRWMKTQLPDSDLFYRSVTTSPQPTSKVPPSPASHPSESRPLPVEERPAA